MVSTRGVKYKFTEGEKVLCYEPDPAKTKVLYNSKVLEIIVSKDDNGKKLVEFLIHFQGWNSTWDRFVTEEYVLKDTEENRQLQKELAEKAQLTAGLYCRGGNLYKRDRKKRRRKLSERISESLEAKRSRGSPATEPDPDPDLGGSSDPSSGPDEEGIPIVLSDTIKRFLEADNKLVTQDNKLSKLPCSPTVVTILEDFVKHWAMKQLLQSMDKNSRSNPTQTVDSICRRLNLCKEVADGIRIYFDFTVGPMLLYRQEREQFKQAVSQSAAAFFSSNGVNQPMKQESSTDDILNEEKFHANCDSGEGERKKSLRSHRSSSSGYEHTNGVSGRINAALPHIKESMSSSANVNSPHRNCINSPRHAALLSQIQSWKIIPSSIYSQQPAPPSLIYGAIHLLRLFVKLPELLQSTNIPEEKLEVVLEYFGYFLKYMEEHKEWYSEENYKDNPVPAVENDE